MKIFLYVLIITGSYFFGRIYYSNVCNKIKFFCELKNIHNDFLIKMQMNNIGIKNYFLCYQNSENKSALPYITKINNLIAQNKNIPLSQIILSAYENKKLGSINEYATKNDIEIICRAYKTIESSGKNTAQYAVKNLCEWLDSRICDIKENELKKVSIIKKSSILVGILLVLIII